MGVRLYLLKGIVFRQIGNRSIMPAVNNTAGGAPVGVTLQIVDSYEHGGIRDGKNLSRNA